MIINYTRIPRKTLILMYIAGMREKGYADFLPKIIKQFEDSLVIKTYDYHYNLPKWIYEHPKKNEEAYRNFYRLLYCLASHSIIDNGFIAVAFQELEIDEEKLYFEFFPPRPLGPTAYQLFCWKNHLTEKPSWLNRCVELIAKAITTEGRYGDVTILADAMEDAGCEDVSHFRTGNHYKGCYLLELLI